MAWANFYLMITNQTVTAYLENNREISYRDYVKTFNVCDKTAIKRRKEDMQECGVSRFMVSHFFDLYCTYPKGFKPKVIEVNRERLSKPYIMPNNGGTGTA